MSNENKTARQIIVDVFAFIINDPRVSETKILEQLEQEYLTRFHAPEAEEMKIEKGGEYLLDGAHKVWVEEIMENGLIEVSYGSSRRTVGRGRLSSYIDPLSK